MLLGHAKILNAVRSSGEIIGRKKFQKMIYIAKKLNFSFQERFEFHFYGPYSEELTLQLEELINMGFLNEVKEKKGGYFQYRYSLTPDGEEFVSMFENHVFDEDLADCLEDMNKESARFLELVSTVLYFETLPREQVYEKVQQVKSKQNYSQEEIEQAFQYIDNLKAKTSQHVQS